MKVLVFDTETTGLPENRNVSVKRVRENWPHIVSISWMVLENDVPISTKSFIVKPNGWLISPSSVKIHGITHEKAMADGYDLEYVINEFISERYDVLVAHNLEFDENVLTNAIYWDLNRQNFVALPERKRCSMKLGRDICKLPSSNPNFHKYPKLSEFYTHVFGNNPIMENLHNSMYDVEVLVRIIQHSQELRQALGLVKPRVKVDNVYYKNSNTLSL